MRLIGLTRGKIAKVSDRDYGRLIRHSWYALRSKPEVYYAACDIERKTVLMQWMIKGCKGIDHKNGDPLDNRRCNLRKASQSLNMANTRRRSDNTSGFKGVAWDSGRQLWRADIMFCYRRFYLGHFSDPAQAARAYDKSALEKFGGFARPNFPIPVTRREHTKTHK